MLHYISSVQVSDTIKMSKLTAAGEKKYFKLLQFAF